MTPATNQTVPTLDRCRAAIAGVRERYDVIALADHFAVPEQGHELSEGLVYRFSTETEAYAWMDEQIALACIGALLPVSDGVAEAGRVANDHARDIRNRTGEPTDPIAEAITAAIGEVLKGEA